MAKHKNETVKAGDLRPGTYKAGSYRVLVSRLPYEACEDDAAEFFSVLVLQIVDGVHYYRDLVADIHWFDHLSSFERPITSEDLVEYNDRVAMRLQKGITMPTQCMSRRSIIHLGTMLGGLQP